MLLGFELIEQTNKDSASKESWTLCPNNENPYSVEKMIKVSDGRNDPSIDKILSIPSPYARMHVTETALIEGTSRPFNELPPVYRRAISHCLDTFELFFLFNGIELAERGVKVFKHRYQTLDDYPDAIFVKALNLFRSNYGREKFKNFYAITLQYNGIDYPLAYTSPFTMFYTPEDINENCNIMLEGHTDHILFSQDATLWKGIEQRSDAFQKFIFALARKYEKPEYNHQFAVLYNYLNAEGRLRGTVHAEVTNGDYFNTNYKKWTVTGSAGIPIKVDNGTLHEVELLPLGYDTFVFENFINTINAHDYSSVEHSSSEKYKIPIEHRTNDFCGQKNPDPLQWITIHDLLQDDVFVTTNHIDANKYLSVPDNDPEIDAILPFKKKFFELFNLFNDETIQGRLISTEKLNQWVSIRYESGADGQEALFGDGAESKKRLYVTLTLPVRDSRTGSFVSVTKTYDSEHIHLIDIDFGIYPFQQVTRTYDSPGPDNFYRIMLYLTNNRLADVNDLRVYAKNPETGLLIDKSIENLGGNFNVQRHATILQENHQGFINENLYYLSLESKYYDKDGRYNSAYYADVRFDFVEAIVDGYPLLIVPRFEPKTLSQPPQTCAVDLGTSNTYVAYGDFGTQNEFEVNYSELVGKLCYRQAEGHQKRVFDFTQGGIHQITELIPTEFGPDEQAHFPIRSVQLYQQSIVREDEINRSVADNGAPFVSMFSMNIPFMFNKSGVRSIGNNTIDTVVTGFKWFSTKNNQLKEMNAYKLFVDQLCFMLRNKLIYNNCNLSQAKLIWLYPLSMSNIEKYKEIWKAAYQKYFCSDTTDKLYQFTESETPIELAEFSGGLNNYYLVGIDIGGGSTDVIVYNRKPASGSRPFVDKPILATSFGFAGNAMFGTLYGHDAVLKNGENIWFTTLKDYVQQEDTATHAFGLETRTVDINPDKSNITEVMDYILTKTMVDKETIVRDAMATPFIRFVNLMHTAALIWEIANVCKCRLGDQSPDAISLSGNGSKLLLMPVKDNREREKYVSRVINTIFSAVYGKKIDNIQVKLLPEPKKATANGAIKLSELTKESNVTRYSCIRYNGKLYYLNAEGLGDETETIDVSETGSGDLFNVNLFGESAIPASMPQSTEPQPSTCFKRDYACPQLDSIKTDKDAIADEVGRFFDLYCQLAVTPLAGRWAPDTLNSIRCHLLGYTNENKYHSKEMYNYIALAHRTLEGKNDSMDETFSNKSINDSVFLAVVAQIMASLMGLFGKKTVR